MRTYLNDNWQYFDRWSDNIFTKDGGVTVRVPHSVAQTPFNCYDVSCYQKVVGYRRNLYLNRVEGKYLLTFEGIAHASEVFVNGISLAKHSCGYTAFTVDITSQLVAGNNQIVVKADSNETLNQPPFGFVIDYQTYGGMYRDVYLDNFVGPYVSDAFVIAMPGQPFKVKVQIADVEQEVPLVAEIWDGEEQIEQFRYSISSSQFEICEHATLQKWDLDNPKVYTLKLIVGKNVYQTTFGVRTARFCENGFFLNDKPVKIVGLNRHQCFPYVGYAMPESMQRRDAHILKEQLCVNAVRTSHYPQSQYFLDECDRLGLLVFTEIPGWQHIGDADWKAIAMHNVEEMVLQYRNHPSIVLWGVRINESLDDDWLYEKTNAWAHWLDPTRQTGGVRYLSNSHLLEDVYTYNDFNRNGATDRESVCDRYAPYLVTEYNGHMFPTKSYDDFPHRREHMLRYARMLDGVFAAKNTSGAFGWCMFDYNTHMDFGSGDGICYHGVMDMFRNPKMAAAVFSCRGSDIVLEPCFTSDIGDYPEGGVGEMYCLTNADYVDVYKGETFIKRYTHKDSPFRHMPHPPILIDDLIGDRLIKEDGISKKYAKLIKQVLADIRNYGVNLLPRKSKMKIASIMMGTKMSMDRLVALYHKYESNWGNAASALTLKANKGGKTLTRVVSATNEIALEISVSSHKLHEKTTYDVAAVNIRAMDSHGNVATYLSKAVSFRVEGPLELIGESTVPLLGGMTGTFVKTVGEKGKAKLFVDNQVVEFEVV